MGHIIIKQPNNRYCIFSTIVDNFVYHDCTPEEIVNYRTTESKKEHEISVMREVKDADRRKKDFQYYIELIEEIHGEEEAKQAIKIITKQDD